MSKHVCIKKGTRVRVLKPFRTPVPGTNFTEWIDWPAGCTGYVRNVSNAGFRGVVHTIHIDGPERVFATGISAEDLEILP